MLIRPKAWQDLAIDYAVNHPYSILGMGPRTGKTCTALGVFESVGGKCLVLCPSALVLHWESEVRKFLGEHIVVTTIQSGKEIYELVDTDIAIITFDLSKKAAHFFDWADTVIIDEGHLLKTMHAKRTEYIHKEIFENSIKRLHILTGTPIEF